MFGGSGSIAASVIGTSKENDDLRQENTALKDAVIRLEIENSNLRAELENKS